MIKNSINLKLLLIFISFLSLTACSTWYTDYGIEAKSQLYEKSSIPLLIEALESDDANDRIRAIRTLALHKHDAKAAVPSLLEIIQNDPEENARHMALGGLKAIEPQYEDVKSIVEKVRDTDSNENVRRRAANLLKVLSGNSSNKYNHVFFSPSGEQKSIELSIKPDFRFYNGYQKVNIVRRQGILPVYFALSNNHSKNIKVNIKDILLTDDTGGMIDQVPLETVAEKCKFSYKKSTITTILGGPIGIPSWIRTAKANKKIDSQISDYSILMADIPSGEKTHWYCFYNVNKSTYSLADWQMKIPFSLKDKLYSGNVKFIGNYEILANNFELVKERAVSDENPKSTMSVKKKLIELNELLDEDLITQKEYESKRKEVIDSL